MGWWWWLFFLLMKFLGECSIIHSLPFFFFFWFVFCFVVVFSVEISSHTLIQQLFSKLRQLWPNVPMCPFVYYYITALFAHLLLTQNSNSKKEKFLWPKNLCCPPLLCLINQCLCFKVYSNFHYTQVKRQQQITLLLLLPVSYTHLTLPTRRTV